MDIKKSSNIILSHLSVFLFLLKLWNADILRAVCILHPLNMFQIQEFKFAFYATVGKTISLHTHTKNYINLFHRKSTADSIA